jgi:hypothetical protein
MINDILSPTNYTWINSVALNRQGKLTPKRYLTILRLVYDGRINLS